MRVTPAAAAEGGSFCKRTLNKISFESYKISCYLDREWARTVIKELGPNAIWCNTSVRPIPFQKRVTKLQKLFWEVGQKLSPRLSLFLQHYQFSQKKVGVRRGKKGKEKLLSR